MSRTPAPPNNAAQSSILETCPVRTRLDHLDGIRGLAALFVVAHHLWREYTKGALPGLEGLATNWLLYGHLAVDVFIVLSGACLMLPVARSGVLRGGWQTFYKNRARRILPPFYAAIVLALVVSHFNHVSFSPAMLIANLLLLQDVLPKTNVLDGSLWSVALEWKIYFLFPVFIWLWSRYGPLAVLLASAVIGYGVMILIGVTFPSFYMTHACPWYVFLFGMGMAAKGFGARLEAGRFSWVVPSLFWVALACFAWMLYAWPITAAGEEAVFAPHLPVIDAAAGMVTALALALMGRTNSRRELSLPVRLLSWRPLVFVGTIGYSLYLIHSNVIYRVSGILTTRLHIHPAFVVIVLDMAITVGLAYLFHLAFERPFMSSSGKPAPQTERQAEVAAVENPAP